jgi:hypothetical protein
MTKTKNTIPKQQNSPTENLALTTWEEELLSGMQTTHEKEAFRHRPAHEQLGVVTVMHGLSEKDERREAFERSDKQQDHGTKGTTRFKELDEGYNGQKRASTIEKQIARDATDEYLASLTPAELQAEADKILGEAWADEDYDSSDTTEWFDEEPEEHGQSMVIVGGEEVLERLRAVSGKKADNYETATGNDAEDYVLDGMHIVKTSKNR